MQSTVIKDQLIKEDALFLKDNTYVCYVTLESVMDEYRNIFESLHHNKPKALSKGSVMLAATPPPKGKKFPKQFKKSCFLCGKQGHKFVNCYSRPENVHNKPGFKTNEKVTYYHYTILQQQKSGHSENQCYKKKNAKGNSNDQVAVMFMVTEHGLLTKGPSHNFNNNTFIADLGATCHMRGSWKACLLFNHI
jgi:hypothetical protein